MKFIISLWRKMTNLGSHPSLSYSEAKRVRLLNIMVFLGVVLLSPYVFEYFLIGANHAAWIQVGTVLVLCTSWLFNHWRKYDVAIYILLLSTAANIFICSSVFTFASGEHLATLIVAMIPFILFDVQNRIKLLVGIFICLSPILFQSIAEGMLAYMVHPPAHPEMTYMKNLYMTIVLILLISFYFQNISNGQLLDVISKGKKELESIFENAYDANFFIDAESLAIVNANDQARRLFETSGSKLEHTNLEDLLGPKILELLQKVSPGTKKWSTEIQVENKEGNLFWTNMAFSHVSIQQTPYLLLRISDISDRKEAEYQLIKAKEKAEEAASLKSQFLSTMSHELRTPMNAVIGMTGLMLDTELTHEQRDFAETIRRSGDSLMNIINDILDFSQMVSGHLTLEKIDFRLDRVVEEAMDILAPQAVDKKLEMIYWIDPQIPKALFGDDKRIRQILFNLLSNAIKFTHHGEIFLRIAWVQKTDGTHTLEFAVKDTGIGIPEEKLDKLFENFSQVDGSDTREVGGTGLGLAIVNNLVKLMGGEIFVESQVNVGTTFFMVIDLPEGNVENLKVIYKESMVLEQKGAKAIVVDDNLTNLKIIEYQCQRMGLIVDKFDDPQEALKSMQAKRYDIGILDMQMPGMDGLELATEVRKLRTKEDFPLILLSSIAEIHHPEIKEVFNVALYKPARENILFRYVDRFLSPILNRAKEGKGEDAAKEKAGDSNELSILLVEDNLVNQKVASRILKKLGYTNDVANNGLEGLEKVRAKKYDLVFMDVQMPEMDGITATREICKEFPDPNSRPTIIALTANVLEEDKKRCFDAGMDDFLPKPVKKDLLKEKIDEWFTPQGV